MIPPLLIWLAGALLRVIAAIARPRVATCPPGYYVEGVRPSGETTCVSTWDPRPDDTKSPEGCHHGVLEVPRLPTRVWCEPAELAVVINERTVGCRKARGT